MPDFMVELRALTAQSAKMLEGCILICVAASKCGDHQTAPTAPHISVLRTSSRRFNVKSVSHIQCGLLIRLKRDFLHKHDVACDEASRWDKTPARDGLPGVIDLMHHPAVKDTIAVPSVTADDVE